MFEPGRPGEFEVTAHRAEVKICTCGCRNQAEFPEGVTAAAQYGSATQAMAVYLNQYHFLPVTVQHPHINLEFSDFYTILLSTIFPQYSPA
ncbi:hypothetical protein [Endozoicomonas sp. SCSIO W0465]|uniref:hypothetical protein n=1 Tax=Endozoicomonas sp. SCSIO W0465 TaxID=2918516 RepID=UPI002076201B|nr:hypothetical protein [Endozoicomonas sp. SCSIO W0465]USE34491.1 hypothetical protein MJO57_20405 [Endozoicomonas sp. SCSIO W0465]